jgi:ABC-2 type transport system ATP-binding protein
MTAAATPALRLVNVTHFYGSKAAVRHASLDVLPGEIVTLVGANGVGKSTLLRVGGGVLTPHEGHAEVFGFRRRSTIEAELDARRRCVYMPDAPYLPLHLRVLEYIVGAGRLWGRSYADLERDAKNLLEVFALRDMGESTLGACSTGQRQKAALCAMLVPETPLLILDEPFGGGLDTGGIVALAGVLKERASRGHAIVLSTPVPEIIDAVATRVALLVDGHIERTGTPAQIRQAAPDGTLAGGLDEAMHAEARGRLEAYLAGRGGKP